MQAKTFDRLLLFTLFFMAYWFFGNLYEEIVMVPNHLADPSAVLTAYQGYFVLSSPTYYFVPVTQLAVVVLFVLYGNAKEIKQRQLLKRAAGFAVLAIVATILIVTQINAKLFVPNFVQYEEQLSRLSLLWLSGNLLRMACVGGTIYFLFQAYVLRQVTRSLVAGNSSH